MISDGDNMDGDNDDMIDSQERLQDAISNLFSIGSSSKKEVDPSVEYSVPDLEDPSTWESVKLQPGSAEWKGALPEQQRLPENDWTPAAAMDNRMQGTAGTNGAVKVSDGFQVDSDSVFLDTNDYIHTRDWLNSDGSLNIPQNPSVDDSNGSDDYQKISESILLPNPSLPDSAAQETENVTLEDVLKQSPPDPSATSEELHKMVFQNEEGYLQQSELFRKALTRESAREEALALRRGAEYRERQAKVVAELEQQIQEFDESLASRQGNATGDRQTCAKCGCVMSDEEIHHFEMLRGVPETKRLCLVCNADMLEASSRAEMRNQAETQGFPMPPPQPWKRNGEFSQRNSIPRHRTRRMPPPVKKNLSRERKSMPTSTVGKALSPQDNAGVPRERETLPRPSVDQLSPPRVNPQVPRERRAIVRPSGDKRPQLHPVANNHTVDETRQIQTLTKQVRILERLVQSYKRKAEMAEQEIFRLRNTIAEMDDDLRAALARGSNSEVGDDAGEATTSPWAEVEDPDTGEIFYWNEETEEMRWELERPP